MCSFVSIVEADAGRCGNFGHDGCIYQLIILGGMHADNEQELGTSVFFSRLDRKLN